MPVELSPEEKNLLIGLLDKELGETRTEIHHTQSHDYKEDLKVREKRLQDLLKRLRS